MIYDDTCLAWVCNNPYRNRDEYYITASQCIYLGGTPGKYGNCPCGTIVKHIVEVIQPSEMVLSNTVEAYESSGTQMLLYCQGYGAKWI